MKFKSIIASGLLLLSVGAATTSCKDMFTADNKLVTTDLAPKDTVYQMMGIIKRMQPLIDRTVLLGEVRADLVSVTPQATTDIKELGDNNVSLNNAYNRPSDYYNVINSCNVFLANVDADRRAAGDTGNDATYYRNEIIAAKCFRAWCYLELAKIYGEVPFVMDPVLSSEDAEQIVSAFNASGSKANLNTIATTLIEDLRDYAALPYNGKLRSDYAAKFYNLPVSYFFIPVRVMLGELYLWRGSYTGDKSDYENAIMMYHDFLTWDNEERQAGLYTSQWYLGNAWDNKSLCETEFYNSNFNSYDQVVCVLPTDTLEFDGNVSELRSIFCSNYKNNYYPLVVPSQHIKDISKAQTYAYYYTTTISSQRVGVVETNPTDANRFFDPLAQGDLRLYSVYKVTGGSSNKYDANLNNERQFITKYLMGNEEILNDQRMHSLPLYRTNIIYLHLAEALNAAGFPETAFVVLKHGLSSKTIANPKSRLIPENEYKRLGQLKSKGMYQTDSDIPEDEYQNSFLVWNPLRFQTFDKYANKRQGEFVIGRYQQTGIHNIGSGDCDMYDNYYLPTDSATYESQLQEVPALKPYPGAAPAEPANYILEFDKWMELYHKGQNPSRYQNQYNNYVKAHNDSVANYEAWVVADQEYKESVVVRDQVIRDNRNVFSIHEDVVAKRQKMLDLMILEEEALEGMFEGQRYYDLMRWAMRNDQAKTSQSVISMPDYNNLPSDHGNISILKRSFTPAQSKMQGKPWYLTLPQR